MKITIENDEDVELIVRIPLYQVATNPYDDTGHRNRTNNLVGVVAGDDYTLSQSIDMEYKGKPAQEGMPILHFDTREELEEVCKMYDIELIEHPRCTFKGCREILRGVMGYGENGVECCEHEYVRQA